MLYRKILIKINSIDFYLTPVLNVNFFKTKQSATPIKSLAQEEKQVYNLKDVMQ